MAVSHPKTYRDYENDFKFWLSRSFNLSLNKPDWVSVNLTLKCNLRCPMCRACYSVENELNLDEIKNILDQIHDWGVKIFNPLGGEPFFRKDILDILAYASEKNFQTTVTNNGTLITAERAKALAAMQRVHLNFSLDGLEETNDSIRGKGVFKKVWESIGMVREEEKRLGDYRKWISINCIVHSLTFEDLITLAEMARDNSCNMIQYLNLFAYDQKEGKENKNPFWIKPEDIARFDAAIDRLCGHIKSDSSGFAYANSISDLQLLKLYYRNKLKPHNAKCYSGFKELYINSNGETLICDARLNFTASSFGNVRDKSLWELWTGQLAKDLRRNVIRCKTPCIQDCYLRRDSDKLIPILKAMARTRLEESPIGRKLKLLSQKRLKPQPA